MENNICTGLPQDARSREARTSRKAHAEVIGRREILDARTSRNTRNTKNTRKTHAEDIGRHEIMEKQYPSIPSLPSIPSYHTRLETSSQTKHNQANNNRKETQHELDK